MKTILLSLMLVTSTFAFAQTKTEKIKVAGECGTCKKKIESAAKKAGANFAVWSPDTKELTIKYNSTSSNTAKIEKSIAQAGYDTPEFKATEAAYKKLDACCQYKRDASTSCCNDAKCLEVKCLKDGKCIPDQSCCKEAGCDKKDCCKKS